MTTSWMSIHYGASNQIQNFLGTNVTTRTDKPMQPGAKQPPPPALTWSHDMRADFDPSTAQLARMEQWGDFRYEEGDRKAHSEQGNHRSEEERHHPDGRSACVGFQRNHHRQYCGVWIRRRAISRADGNVNSTRCPSELQQLHAVAG